MDTLTEKVETSVDLGNLGKLKELVESAVADFQKAKDGMRQPGTRVRKTMMEVKKLANDIRKEMLDSRPAKTKKAKS